MMKQLALSGIFCVCFAGLANAATVSGNFTGTIDAPSGATGSLVSTGGGTNALAWGTPNSGSNVVEAGNSSSLTVNNGSFSEDVVSAGRILLGTITWNNQSNWNTGSSWTSGVNLTLDFADLAPVDQSVDFSILNTTDLSGNTDFNETTGQRPDWISSMQLGSDAFDVPIALGDGLTLTSVFFQMVSPGSAGTSVDYTAGISYGGDGSWFNPNTGNWVNREGGTSTIGIYGEVSTVPLPAGVWFLLGGLGGLAALGRRRTKQTA